MSEKKITVHKHIPHAERVRFVSEFDQVQQLEINRKLYGDEAAKKIIDAAKSADEKIFSGRIRQGRDTSGMLQQNLDNLSKQGRQPLSQTTNSNVWKVDWVEYTKILHDPEFVPVTKYIDKLKRPLIQQEKGTFKNRIVCLYKVDDNTI